MCDTQEGDKSKPNADAAEAASVNSKFQELALHLLLQDVVEQLRSIKAKLESNQDKRPKPDITSSLIEVLKVALTGWPAFGIIFLLLFYSPVHDAITSIPEKVRRADEIHVAGIALKSALKTEAIKVGDTDLADVLPKLSFTSIKALLNLPKKGSDLLSFIPDSEGKIQVVLLSSEQHMAAIEELFSAKLVVITKHQWDSKSAVDLTAEQAKEIFHKFQEKYSRFLKLDGGNRRLRYELDQAIPKSEIPPIMVSLSPLGRQAAEIIVKAAINSNGKSLAN